MRGQGCPRYNGRMKTLRYWLWHRWFGHGERVMNMGIIELSLGKEDEIRLCMRCLRDQWGRHA